jgi:hypothetical protein
MLEKRKALEVTQSYLCLSRPRYGLLLNPPEVRHAGKASGGHSVSDTVCHDMAPKKIVKPTDHGCIYTGRFQGRFLHAFYTGTAECFSPGLPIAMTLVT